MAGEKLGRAFELLTLVELEKCGYILRDTMHWNVAPANCSIDPDITIGDADKPEAMFLITSSRSANNSNMKTWRNLGEMFEAVKKTGCGNFVNVIFEAGQDAGLQELMSKLTRQLIIDHHDWGRSLIRAVKAAAEEIPTGRDQAISHVREWRNANAKITAPFRRALSDVLALPMGALNTSVMKAVSSVPDCIKLPSAKTTYLKRGIAKLLLIEKDLRNALYGSSEVSWKGGYLEFYLAFGLLVERANRRVAVSDQELRWVLRHYSGSTLEQLIADLSSESEGLLDQYVSVVRGGGELLGGLLVNRWKDLTNPERLIELFDETTQEGNYVGLFWEIVELIRQHRGGDQSYGFAEIAADVGYTEGISSGYKHLSDWANGRQVRVNATALIKDVSSALAKRLLEIGQKKAHQTCPKMIEAISKNTFEQKLVSYPKLEPIPLLLLQYLKSKSVDHEFIRRRSSLLGEITGRNASLTNQVIETGGYGICWKTGYPKGRAHKVKEAMGKGPTLYLKYAGNKITARYMSGTILILDGVFTQADIRNMGSAGWTEIYWIDEIEGMPMG